METRADRRLFPQVLRVLSNYHECFYNTMETRRTCCLLLLENSATAKKRKQLGYFDHQNVNSLFSRHPMAREKRITIYDVIITSTARASCVFLSRHDFWQIIHGRPHIIAFPFTPQMLTASKQQ